MSDQLNAATTATIPVDENQLMQERREKLKALRQQQAQGQGVAFPNDFKPCLLYTSSRWTRSRKSNYRLH